MCSITGRLTMGTMGLGMASEYSRMRMPRPPQKRTTFIVPSLSPDPSDATPSASRNHPQHGDGNYELATVTAVGKAATQTTLVAPAVAGATNIKVAASADMNVGNTLTVGTGGRKELVKVTSVGTGGASGSGVDLSAPITFDHMSGVDVSDVGTGISFSPATRFPHLSGDAVQALGSGVTIDRPLAKGHAYGAPLVSRRVTTVGYQGPPAPHQWFGGALSPRAGSIALLDAGGAVVVDAMVYGSQQSSSSGNGTIASPEIATLEADQGQGGCIVVVPSARGGFGPAASAAGTTDRSVGRFPDGFDADSLCRDFLTQAATTLSAASAAGGTNIKVASVSGFATGHTVTIDAGANAETAVIAEVGTAGATIGINRFGESGKGPAVMAHLGITPENVAQKALALLGK